MSFPLSKEVYTMPVIIESPSQLENDPLGGDLLRVCKVWDSKAGRLEKYKAWDTLKKAYPWVEVKIIAAFAKSLKKDPEYSEMSYEDREHEAICCIFQKDVSVLTPYIDARKKT